MAESKYTKDITYEDVPEPRVVTIEEVATYPAHDELELALVLFEELEGGILASKEDVFDATGTEPSHDLKRCEGKRVVLYDDGPFNPRRWGRHGIIRICHLDELEQLTTATSSPF